MRRKPTLKSKALDNSTRFINEIKLKIFLSNTLTQKQLCYELGISESTFIRKCRNNSFTFAECLYMANRTGVNIEDFRIS